MLCHLPFLLYLKYSFWITFVAIYTQSQSPSLFTNVCCEARRVCRWFSNPHYNLVSTVFRVNIVFIINSLHLEFWKTQKHPYYITHIILQIEMYNSLEMGTCLYLNTASLHWCTDRFTIRSMLATFKYLWHFSFFSSA